MVSLGALGVVYGDIGTSPLYAMKEFLTGEHGAPPTPANVYGVLSLVFWALTLVVVIKYLMFVLRADNKGEGGIQALAALVSGATGRSAGKLAIPILMALFGTGLLYGEGVLTPAISVLSAVEGLNVATDSVEHLVLPITVAILVGLFVVQRFGTHRIGTVFGYGCLALSRLGQKKPSLYRGVEGSHPYEGLMPQRKLPSICTTIALACR